MGSITNNLQEVKRRIQAACLAAGRSPDSAILLAVSKTMPAAAVQEAHAAGQREFGENYVQEALDKIEALAAIRGHLVWHLIGPLQSNKTRPVAQAFDWVHTVDRLKIAQRLAEQRPAHLPPLNLCLQVNVSGEASKNGVAPADVLALAQAVAGLPPHQVQLRGLMSIPEPAADAAAQRAPHRLLRELLHSLREADPALAMMDTLSMGMSADLEAAVAEGSTLLRVGSAVFGVRAAQHPGSVTPEDRRYQMTLEALADVDAERGIVHHEVEVWIDSLGTEQPLPPPSSA